MQADDDGQGGHSSGIGTELGREHSGLVDPRMFRDEDAARRRKIGMRQDLLGGEVVDRADAADEGSRRHASSSVIERRTEKERVRSVGRRKVRREATGRRQYGTGPRNVL